MFTFIIYEKDFKKKGGAMVQWFDLEQSSSETMPYISCLVSRTSKPIVLNVFELTMLQSIIAVNNKITVT